MKLKIQDLLQWYHVTDVKVTKDLRYAKVFVSIFGKDEEEKNNTFHCIKKCKWIYKKRN